MTLRVWGSPFSTAQFSNTDKYVTFDPQQNMTLKALRTWFVLYNTSFTTLKAKIYSEDRSGLIATSSTSWTEAELATESYSYVSTYFEFTTPINLKSGATYVVVINGTGYTYSDSAHMAWVHAYPDPIHAGYTADGENAFTAPFKCEFYADEYY